MNWSAGKIGTIIQKPAQAIGLSTPPIGCVLYLPGLPGGGNKIYDRSPYGNIGTITGAVWKVLPSGLWVLDFDGTDDYVSCGNATSLLGAATGTFEAWMYSEDADNSETCIVVSFGDTDADEYILLFTSVGKLGANCKKAGVVQWQSLTDAVIDDYLTWVHLAVIQDGVSPILLVNGDQPAQTFSTSTDKTKWAGDLTGLDNSLIAIASFNNDASRYDFQGKLALPRIYNRALSALEIQNHYQQEKHLFGAW